MADARQVAEGFFDAWTGKDFERARGLLHDDVSFAGPIDRFSDADSYLASLRRLSGIVAGAELAHLPVVPGARRLDGSASGTPDGGSALAYRPASVRNVSSRRGTRRTGGY